jgi:hypothetical protein
MSIIDEANRDLEALLQKCKVTDAKIKNVQDFEPDEEGESMKIYIKAKCRNCGEIFNLDEPIEVILSNDQKSQDVMYSILTNFSVCTHLCNNGEFGIADGIALIIRE